MGGTLDIKGFFEHITYEHLKSVLDQNVSLLKNHGYILSDDDFLFIKKICFIGDHLVMGSVVSPSISNVIMFNFDQCIIEDIEKSNMRYTRYADDIYISSKTHISNSVLAEVISELSKMGFEINRDKTSFFSILSRPLITGVLIRQDREISLGLSYRKMIKGLVYKKLRYGEGDSRKILGYLSYLRFMEPITYNRILLKYSYFGNVLKLLKKDIIKEV